MPREPPAPVEELPPEARPEGEQATWIPGYWSWDDEQSDFIWVSGVWRNAPQGREWVPGNWQPVEGGYRWMSGWSAPAEGQVADALPPPPASLEQGPTSEPTSEDDFWVPGSWQYREQRYVWRPGFWTPCYENWVWVPDYYVSTVNGCNYVPGYWDYAWERRGILFAPCRFHHLAIGRPGFVYRPSVVVDLSGVFFHLWVRPSYGCYYFGDYYDDYLSGIRLSALVSISPLSKLCLRSLVRTFSLALRSRPREPLPEYASPLRILPRPPRLSTGASLSRRGRWQKVTPGRRSPSAGAVL